MPTDAYRRSAGGLPVKVLASMGAAYPRPNDHIIATWSYCAIGEDLRGQAAANFASGTYPGSGRVIAFPFIVAHPFLVRKVFWFNGTTATTDSVDVGVYKLDDPSSTSRVVSGGGTLASGASGTQEVNVTDTLLPPGRYYCAYTQNGTTATPILSTAAVVTLRVAGCIQQTASGYPLPSTLSVAAVSSANIPLFGIASRTLAS